MTLALANTSGAIAPLDDYKGGVPDNYEPAHGLKSIAVAEAAENYFARAKDSTQLYAAVQVKLGEQRRFVLWWDGQEKDKGGRPAETCNGAVTGFLKSQEFGLDHMTISRWRKRLKDAKKFDEALEKAHERCVKVCEARSGHNDEARASNSGEQDWHTPAKHLEAARRVLGGFDLDPASSDVAQERVQAERHFTKADDGLAQPWRGRVWLNPPYSHPEIREFAEKLVAEYQAGNVTAAIMLTNNSTDTEWFQDAAAAADGLCFTKGRIKFVNPRGEEVSSPLQGQAFFYFGPDADSFFTEFLAIGLVAEVVHGA